MRLLEIKIRNIASLKGEHLISFRDLMAASPLFAITGETGSGKSSILNSIGLALYGRVFKSSVQQNDVVTLGEKDGEINLLFQVREKTYLAVWKARVRKQNGDFYSTPQSPTRDLYEMSGENFDSPKNISDKKTEDILHLDFDQFCKCVILNQGEFARFLSSSFTERKDILEKLYPGDVLEGLSGRLRYELEESRGIKDKLEVEMSTLQGAGQNGAELKVHKTELSSVLAVSEKRLTLIEGLDGQYKTLHHYFEENLKNQKKLEITSSDIAELTKIQNENLSLSNQALEAYEGARKVQDSEGPRLQELLKLEEKEQSLHELENSQNAKLERARINFDDAVKKHSASAARENDLSIQKDELEKKLKLPASELRVQQKNLEHLFDLHHELTLLKESQANSKKRLDELEEAGKERSKELQDIKDKKEALPKTIAEDLLLATQEREKLNLEKEKKHRAQVLSQELDKTLKTLSEDLHRFENESAEVVKKISLTETEISPLRTTQKLSGLLTAVTVCRTHETTIQTDVCPVCETKLSSSRWEELRGTLDGDELKNQMQRLDVLERELIRSTEEKKTLDKNLKTVQENLAGKKLERSALTSSLDLVLKKPEELDERINLLNKQKWEWTQFAEAEKKLSDLLIRARDEFARARNELQLRITAMEKKDEEMNSLRQVLKDLLPAELNAEVMSGLKTTLTHFKEFREKETLFDRARQEKTHLEETLAKYKTDLDQVQKEHSETKASRARLVAELTRELGTEKASEKILALLHKVKALEEEYKKREAHHRKQDLVLKEASSRLILLNELLKEVELQFIKAREDLRTLASSSAQTERENLNRVVNSLKSINLDFKSSPDLFIPLKEIIFSEKEFFAAKVSAEKEELAATMARLADWEKRQDKITLLELKNKDLLEKLNRLERLYDVLGKDELRTFVLALVEENLIEQTNEELQKLCQGRYEIIHQSRKMKLTPEFYVLDKFREGGLRKVATLSGGETFMVSLAMAIALAEMTRGQAEIDSLFIDEGFGTLDQDSLEDVLDMLNQIQTRGLMVGVISHIKALTSALPVNLLLSKRQDGTSSVSLQYN